MSRIHHQQRLLVCSSPQQQRCDNWIFLDVPSDITIEVSGLRFALHKFPLVTKSGRIRKLIAEHKDADTAKIELFNLPGGPETFQLAAKFCYGINFEITTANVAQLRCASDYLEMTEEYADDNLSSRSESYLDDVVCKSLELCVEVLHQCESLLPLADELKIVNKCTDAIASKACAEQIASSFSRLEYSSGRLHMNKQVKCSEDWWIEDLSVLRIDLYQRVIEAIKCRGVRPETIGASLVDFTEKFFKKKPLLRSATCEGIQTRYGALHDTIDCEEKMVVETIASLLPTEKHAVPIRFLFGLLRSVMILDCTMLCRLNIERRIGSQLEMATLDDLLMPSIEHAGDKTMFDVDTVHRILVIFSQQDESDDDDDDDGLDYNSEDPHPPSQNALDKVGRLVDNYLAEIAPDANLKLAKFMAIAETLPGYARTNDDGLYRAIDIYLKAHQGLSELERKRLYKLIDFHKLSEEATAHAAQNERLPVQATVQVLYIEQLRLRSALRCSPSEENQKPDHPRSWGMSNGVFSAGNVSPPDNYASLRRENRELKLELARMRLRLSDLEKGHACMKQDLEKSNSRKFMITVSKRIRKLNLFSGSPLKGSSIPSKSPLTEDSKLSSKT
ncbi:BTB/POZ domain-containing protein [Canna indica]|uniref:BTB/POZ domain-containing protein n=1 Tax=Canna indica TaxID=4628 RepID=A0AAQ3KY20_9LILI|nr:BTB/POZ domain-containing protein [Canna indica]